MGKPKSWAEANQRTIGRKAIEWDGEATNAYVPVAAAVKPVLIAVDNEPNAALTLTFEHLLSSEEANASVQIGEGENGVLTISMVETGDTAGTLAVMVNEEPDEEMSVSVGTDPLTVLIILGTDSEGDPDDTKNTIELIAAYINENHDETITAEASGDGSGTISAATEAPIPFTGGIAEVWGEVVGTNGTAISYTAPAQKASVVGPISGFPRFLGGRIKVTAGSAPTEGTVTAVRVIEA